MSSLVPGQIFVTTGLNRNSTPTPPDTTPAQLDQRYRRIDFNGHTWPCDSPISRAYDVANTSTKLIILNNKYGKKGTRLRGYYTGPKKPERHVDPNRHRAESPRNPRFHTSCYDSSSPKFEPTIKTDLEWVNSSQRPPNALIGALLSLSDDHHSELDLPVSIVQTDGKTDTISVNLSSVFDMPLERPPIKPKKLPLHKARHSVNPRRHASCMATPELPMEDIRSRSRMSLPPNKYFTNSEFSDMSIGEKIYMWSIEKIYNMDKMKQLKQEQYKKLLDMEAKKGYHGYREYSKYMRYINSAKDRSYGTGTPSDKRSRSAYSPRSQRSKSATSRTSPTKTERSEDDKENEKEDKQERPKTSLGHSRQEPLNDSKPPASDSKNRTSSPDSRKSLGGSQKSLQKSPSPSRKSSAKSARSNSQRSLRSRSESRASSAYSAKSVGKTNGDQSDSSLSNIESGKPQVHKEGKDRPKSRLGHQRADSKDQNDTDKELDLPNEGKGGVLHFEGVDRPKSRLGHPSGEQTDKDSLHSSTLSIKSSSTSFSSDSGVENGRKDKKRKQLSDSSSVSLLENRRTNQDKRKNEQPSVPTRQNKTMGSRSSVNSKNSASNDTDNRKNSNQNKESKSSERENRKENAEKEVKVESQEKDTKIHKIPSVSFTAEEKINDDKTQYKTDDEKIELEKEKQTSDVEVSNTEQVNDNEKESKNDDTIQPNNSTDDTEGKVGVLSAVQEQKSENETMEKQEEIDEKINDKGEDKIDEKSDENKNEPEDSQAGEKPEDNVKPDTDVTDKAEIKAETKEENTETMKEKNEPQEEKTEPQIKEQEAGNEKNDEEGRKLSRQDSFEEDEDRKVNKDLDKIEY